MGKWIRMLYVIDAWLFPVAIVVQVFFVGLSLFTGQAFWSIHITFGHFLGLLPLLLVCLSYLGRLSPRLARVGGLPHPGRSLCGHPRRHSPPCCLPHRAGSGALCSRPDHRLTGSNGGAGGGPNVLRFAAPRSHGSERIFGSRLNQKRTYPVLRGSRFSLAARRTFVLSRQPLVGNRARH
jgi:hypothetical protein